MRFRNFLVESDKIERVIRREFPEVRLVMDEYDNYSIIKTFLIQERRRHKGEARAFMEKFIELSNKYHKDIYLSASDVYGGDLNKLKKFYKSLGFTKNTNKDIDQEYVYIHK